MDGLKFVRHFDSLRDASDASLRILEVYAQRGAAKISQKAGFDGNKVVVVLDVDATLVNDKDGSPIDDIVRLAQAARARGSRVHVVTARLDDAEMLADTEALLEELAVEYDSLTLAPDHARDSMAIVSLWKDEQRRRIAEQEGAPVFLSVGDNWSDALPLDSVARLGFLNKVQARDASKHVGDVKASLFRTGSGPTLYGLKVPTGL